MDVLKDHTAGDPQLGTRWTNLTRKEIADLISKRGVLVSRSLVRKLLKRNGYVRRKALKRKSFKSHPDRDAQFRHIDSLRAEFTAAGRPVISLDTKKKELLGNLYRDGKLYTQETIETLDHDFPSYAVGKVVPHGIYDINANQAHVNIGTSADTSEFACNSLIFWWNNYGKLAHPGAKKILILCDGGGSNASNSNLFKTDLQAFVNATGLQVTIAHYPPYCSKYNPIEHRVFPHITRACQGVVFTSVNVVKELIAKASTTTGLNVTVAVLEKVYETGRKVTDIALAGLNMTKGSVFPKWNYRIAGINRQREGDESALHRRSSDPR